MAITFHGLALAIPLNFVPDGMTIPPITKIDRTDMISHNFTIAVSKLTAVIGSGTDPKIGFAQLMNEAEAGSLAYITKYFNGAENVESFGEVTKISTNSMLPSGSAFYTEVAVDYLVDIKLFLKLS